MRLTPLRCSLCVCTIYIILLPIPALFPLSMFSDSMKSNNACFFFYKSSTYTNLAFVNFQPNHPNNKTIFQIKNSQTHSTIVRNNRELNLLTPPQYTYKDRKNSGHIVVSCWGMRITRTVDNNKTSTTNASMFTSLLFLLQYYYFHFSYLEVVFAIIFIRKKSKAKLILKEVEESNNPIHPYICTVYMSTSSKKVTTNAKI